MATEAQRIGGVFWRVGETTWPDPDHVYEIAYAMRYAPERVTREQMLSAATAIEIYSQRKQFPAAIDRARKQQRKAARQP